MFSGVFTCYSTVVGMGKHVLLTVRGGGDCENIRDQLLNIQPNSIGIDFYLL